MTIVQIPESSAQGAAFMSAHKFGIHLPIHSETNYTVLAHIVK